MNIVRLESPFWPLQDGTDRILDYSVHGGLNETQIPGFPTTIWSNWTQQNRN